MHIFPPFHKLYMLNQLPFSTSFQQLRRSKSTFRLAALPYCRHPPPSYIVKLCNLSIRCKYIHCVSGTDKWKEDENINTNSKYLRSGVFAHYHRESWDMKANNIIDTGEWGCHLMRNRGNLHFKWLETQLDGTS